MTQENKIQEALDMIRYFDWYWRMCDLGYMEERRRAYSGMRRFVEHVCTIPNKAVREALRNLWTLKYRETQDSLSGEKNDYTEKRNEYMAVLAS